MSARQILITVQRPGGEVETIDLYPKLTGMTDHMFATIQRDTRAAGRGEVLSYEIIEPADTRTEAERAWEAVAQAANEAEQAERASYYDPAGIIRAKGKAEQALGEWRAQYPEAAEQMDAESRRDRGLPTNDDARLAGERE